MSSVSSGVGCGQECSAAVAPMFVIVIIDPTSTVSVLATTTSSDDLGDIGDDDDNGGWSMTGGAKVLGVAWITCIRGAKSAAAVLGSMT
jgi:hypothetical protein